jgi:hypothetical protein
MVTKPVMVTAKAGSGCFVVVQPGYLPEDEDEVYFEVFDIRSQCRFDFPISISKLKIRHANSRLAGSAFQHRIAQTIGILTNGIDVTATLSTSSQNVPICFGGKHHGP